MDPIIAALAEPSTIEALPSYPSDDEWAELFAEWLSHQPTNEELDAQLHALLDDSIPF